MSFPFTIQQFLILALVLSLVWYAGVFLWLYRKRRIGLRVGGSGRIGSLRSALPGKGSVVELDEPDFDEQELMGKVKLPEGMEVVSSSELCFSDAVLEGAEGNAGASQSDQLGLIPDVLEEIKEVFGILVKEDGTKQDFFRLMKLIQQKYPRIRSHPGLRGLNAYIREHASFHLSASELDDLWD